MLTLRGKANAEGSTMTYDAGHPCCAEYGQMKREIGQLQESLSDLLRICDAVRFSVGFGKNQMERINKAKALLPKTPAQSPR